MSIMLEAVLRQLNRGDKRCPFDWLSSLSGSSLLGKKFREPGNSALYHLWFSIKILWESRRIHCLSGRGGYPSCSCWRESWWRCHGHESFQFWRWKYFVARVSADFYRKIELQFLAHNISQVTCEKFTNLPGLIRRCQWPAIPPISTELTPCLMHVFLHGTISWWTSPLFIQPWRLVHSEDQWKCYQSHGDWAALKCGSDHSVFAGPVIGASTRVSSNIKTSFPVATLSEVAMSVKEVDLADFPPERALVEIFFCCDICFILLDE